MVPELTHDESERVMLNSARYAFTILANVMVFITMFFVLHFFGDGSSDNSDNPATYSFVTYIVLSVGGLTSSAFLFGTAEVAVDTRSSVAAVATKQLQAAADAAVAAALGDGEARDEKRPLLLDSSAVLQSLSDGAVANTAAVLEAPVRRVPPHALLLPSETEGQLRSINVDREIMAGRSLGEDDDGDDGDVGADDGEEDIPVPATAGPIVPSGAGSQMHISSFRRKLHMSWRDWLRVKEFYKVAAVYM